MLGLKQENGVWGIVPARDATAFLGLSAGVYGVESDPNEPSVELALFNDVVGIELALPPSPAGVRSFSYAPTGDVRADRSFRILQDYLNQNIVSLVEGDVRLTLASTVFIQTFDNDVHELWTLRAGNTLDVSYVPSGRTGARAFRKESGRAFLEFPSKIPFDSFPIYRFRCRVRAPASAAAFRWGVQGIAADETVVGTDGTNDPLKPHVVGADVSLPADAEWTEVRAYLGGYGALGSTSPGASVLSLAKMHPNVRWFAPFFDINPSGAGGVVELDYIAIDLLTAAGEVDALATINAPAEPGAQAFAGKDFSLLTQRFSGNLARSPTDPTAIEQVVVKFDNVGDLRSTILAEDGAGKRVVVKGLQTSSALDGAVVSFSPVFQNVPLVVFDPGGLTQLPDRGLDWLVGYLGLPTLGERVTDVIERVAADGLSASGFIMVAKLIERDMAVTEQTENFPVGTLTTDGASLARGALAADAGDDEYRTKYDITLNIDSADALINQDQDFPAGLLVAAGEFKEVSLNAEANNDTYDVRYGINLKVTAAESPSTVSDNFPSGTIGAVDTSKQVVLSQTANDGKYTAWFDLQALGADVQSVTLAVDADVGAGFVEKSSKVVSATGQNNVNFTDAAVVAGHGVRLRVKAITCTPPEVVCGTPTIDPLYVQYTKTGFTTATVTVKVAVKSLAGGAWVTHDTSTFSVTDTDGVENTNVQTGILKTFVRDGVQKVRVEVTEVTVTGSPASKTHEVDPEDVRYTSGTAETATITVVVAVDSKDGAGAWVERSTKTHALTDSAGTGQNRTDSNQVQSFVDSLIDAGDDIRVRIKSVTITGNTDSWSFSADPTDVKYNTFSGTEVSNTKTPLTSDKIPFKVMAA